MAFGYDDAAMLALGAVNAGLGMMGGNVEKRTNRRLMSLEKKKLERNVKRSKQELTLQEHELRRQDDINERNINEDMNGRGVLHSSLTNDAQGERQHQLDTKLSAMDRARQDLDWDYKMAVEQARLTKQMTDANNWITMLQTAIQGGAMGVSAALS